MIFRPEVLQAGRIKEKKNKCFILPLLHLQGKKKEEQCRSKRYCFALFFSKHETASFWTKRAISFKYDANMSTSKSVLSYLLFISIASLPTSIGALIVGCLSTFVLGLRFMQFDPQWINKLLISSIWPLIWLLIAPLFTRLFQFGPWFHISSIKSLIGHQTSIFMQLSPDLTKSTLKNNNLTPEL